VLSYAAARAQNAVMEGVRGAQERIARRLRRQAAACEMLGSPLYARLLEATALDVLEGGPAWSTLEGRDMDDAGSALALRFLGAIHRLVLSGRAPDLAEHYPSAGGSPTGAAEQVFLETVKTLRDEIRALLDRPVQTNEVGRAAGLIGGFLTVAKRSGLPLRIVEIGASAGLLLRWDHFRYEARGETWGPPDSPVRLCDFNSEVPLPFDAEVEVASRAGCDMHPVDPTSEDGQLTLLSYVWPDQIARVRNLRAALELAQHIPVDVECSNAAHWLERELARPQSGYATVVYHSIVLQYLSEDDFDRVGQAITTAGRAANPGAPLAWLRMEPGGEEAHVRLTMWPEGRERLVATCSYHGAAVRWLGYG
jgi:hypothetical protein